MKNAILMKSETEFFLEARGHKMTLQQVETVNGTEWTMTTENAAVDAYNWGFAIPKFFRNLHAVEAKHKLWRGVSLLIPDYKIASA